MKQNPVIEASRRVLQCNEELRAICLEYLKFHRQRTPIYAVLTALSGFVFLLIGDYISAWVSVAVILGMFFAVLKAHKQVKQQLIEIDATDERMNRMIKLLEAEAQVTVGEDRKQPL